MVTAPCTRRTIGKTTGQTSLAPPHRAPFILGKRVAGGPDRFAENSRIAVETTEYIAFAVDGKVLINSSSLEPSTDVLIWDRVPFYLILNPQLRWMARRTRRTHCVACETCC